LNPLKSHYTDILGVRGARQEDVVFILNQSGSSRCLDEVIETRDVVNLTNGNIRSSPSNIPISLIRANIAVVGPTTT
jgi:hypothetical protein